LPIETFNCFELEQIQIKQALFSMRTVNYNQ